MTRHLTRRTAFKSLFCAVIFPREFKADSDDKYDAIYILEEFAAFDTALRRVTTVTQLETLL